MSLFDRILGKTPPRVPPNKRAVVVMADPPFGTSWVVRVEDKDGKRLGGTFTRQDVAYAYADWCNGEALTFEYPSGAA